MVQWLVTADCKRCHTSQEEYLEAGIDTEIRCEDCFPSVHNYNKASYTVYTHTQDQHILGMSGAVAINSLAIDSIMNDYEIVDGADRLEIRSEVKHIYNLVQDAQRLRAKAIKG